MKITRLLNNNVVMVMNDNSDEMVVCGKGIAFRKKVGEYIDDSKVNKTFVLTSGEMDINTAKILEHLPYECIITSKKIVETATMTIGRKLNDNIYIVLADHIHMAVERTRKGNEISNPMLWDIRCFYSTEFEIAKTSLDIINNDFGIRLPEAEIGYIALHIVNAEEGENLNRVYEMTKMIQEITAFVRRYFMMNFDIDSVEYYRFINHLKFFARRILDKKHIVDSEMDDIFKVIKNRFLESYDCASKIEIIIQRDYQFKIKESEKIYLTIHIERVRKVSEKRKED